MIGLRLSHCLRSKLDPDSFAEELKDLLWMLCKKKRFPYINTSVGVLHVFSHFLSPVFHVGQKLVLLAALLSC